MVDTAPPDNEVILEAPSHLVTTKNSAARFAYRAAGDSDTTGTANELVFVDELDAFVPRSEVPESVTNMATRKGFKKLGVDLKDPTLCDLNYVFKVATAAVEKQDGEGSLRACKDFARKCFKSANKRDTALGAIMSMIPGDVYGSVISGGIMTILAVADEYEKKRQAVETALADIPKKLNRVQRLSDLHIKSKRLHEKADGVLVAIFVVFEAIINDLTMDFTSSLTVCFGSASRRTDNRSIARVKFKMKLGAEDQVTNALSSLDDSLSEFQAELYVCTQVRMGRMDEGIRRIEDVARSKSSELVRVGNEYRLIEEFRICTYNNAEIATNLNTGNSNAVTRDNLQEVLCNALHCFYASNPHFNPINGGVQYSDPLAVQLAETGASAKGGSNDTISLSERNSKVFDGWKASIGDFDSSSENHVKECIHAGLGQLTLEDREKSEWIMSSPEVRNWLRLDKSNILDIRSENAPQGLFHPLSFTAALLAETLQKSTDYPILSFFCGLRTNDTFDVVSCGPMAVLKSLNGQLLKFCLESRPGVDMSLLDLKKKRLIKKSAEEPKYALRLFHELLGLLEGKDVVFVILDSWSRLLGDRTQADKVVEKLSQTIKDLPDIVLKVLVLDALPSDAVKELAYSSLYVPEEIDGWRNDVQLSHLEQSNLTMIEELRATQKKEREDLAESDSEGSDENW
ncbi:hypothetical protein CT0861_06274 [Colletotrichum tofieldiae]|uniref:Uncharacterized protein n=1 Tax=Colletotrichum tofieldiae TaxID=708197 RepID=A0A166SAG0_9PEZI|nr:hypothetical protein CT0861_06274 [Colletotrichum tofieldiae]